MKKRLLAFLLSLAMVAGMLPMSAMEAKAANDEIIAENVSGDSFTDTTANPDESYVYTIEGSDGSVQEIKVLAEGEEGTGNSVTTGTVAAGTKYVKATELKSGETYLLVNNSTALIKDDSDISNVGTGSVTINSDDTISGPLVEYEWTITKTDSGYTLMNSDGRYLNMANTYPYENWPDYATFDVVLSGEAAQFTITSNDNDTFILSLDNAKGDGDEQYIYFNKSDVTARGFYYKTPFTLYAKEEVTGADSVYIVATTGLDTLIAECDKLLEQNYTADSWAAFETALTSAKNAKAALEESYDKEEAALVALASIDAAQNTLLVAKKALVQLETIVIRPEWERTLEPANRTYGDKGELIVDLEYIFNDPNKTDEQGNKVEDTNYSIISWKNEAERVLDLSTDPSMTVWDYNKEAQYATQVPKVDNVYAATWNEHENETGDSWRYGSVRRFSGTFTWPAGYTVDDTVIYQSRNDANYKAIYDYINSVPELKARYGNSKVYPINDDMFVFIRKADDELTANDLDYLNHMLFWSGTSGKGLWSTSSTNGADWGRTTPPTFNSINALPAYYRVMPNNDDVAGGTATQTTKQGLNYSKFQHSDGWYTLLNSNTVMSTVKKLYGVEDLSNQEMVIDIFCFDNSTSGGMDEVELIFQRTPETATSVQVNYYLDSVLAANLLGSTVMTGVEDGTAITLHAGTNVNELDHMRFAAAQKAGTVVSDGVQQDPIPYIVDIDKEQNIINVVYTPNNADDREYYFYDFGVENEYIYKPKEEAVLNQNYKITKVENTNKDINVSISEDEKDVVIKYTPTHSRGEVAVGTLNIVFDGAYRTEVKPIVIAPASNVFYEENFMKQSTDTGFANWITTQRDDIASVIDNETTVFGYTSSYESSTGDSGVHTAIVNNHNAFTDNLQFEFAGTGFDLIGTCGPNTGTISVRVVNSAGKAVKNYLVDTSFTDGAGVMKNEEGENVADPTIYQVPLLQAKDLPEDTYTVTIRGAYIVYEGGASTYSLNGRGNTSGRDPIADIYELCYGVGMTDDDIDSLEYINMGKLMGASTYAATDDELETASTTTPAPDEMIIAIDGFRSYRSTNYNKYPKNELGVVYQNILDCVSDGFAGYIENKEDGTYQVNEYEISGGPQNEIYLTSTNTSAKGLVIGQSNSVSKQISLRSVDGKDVTVQINGGSEVENGKTITLKHTTEMYYEVTANENGYIIIQVESGFLGIGNLKLTSGNANEAAVMPTALTDDDYALVATTMRLYAAAPELPEEELPEETPEETPVFAPGKFEVTTKVQKNKFKTTIVTSTDVEYITVNGEVITKAKVKKPTNEKEFTFEQKFDDNATVELEIIAYNSDDLASEAKLFVIENEAVNKKPGKEEDKKPGKEEDKKPGKEEDKKPGKEEDKKPGKEENKKPGKEENKKPGKEENKKPGKVEDKKPGKEENKGGKK